MLHRRSCPADLASVRARTRAVAVLSVWLLALGTFACGTDESKDGKDAGDEPDVTTFDGGGSADTALADTVADTGAVDSGAGTDGQSAGDGSTDISWPGDGACTPDCKGKLCGPDGCGSVCGFCPTGEFCAKDGSKCEEFCKPQCEGKVCGDNGCGGDCGTCGAGKHCGIDFLCYADDCKGSCEGKVCGDNGCGGSCGSCATGDLCDSSGSCKPSPCKGIPADGKCDGDILLGCKGTGATASKTTMDCSVQLPVGSKICAWDPLASKHGCIDKPPCTPVCTKTDGSPKECGDDGCGGICKSCLEGWACEVDSCKVKPGAVCGGTFNSKTGACDGNTWLLCSAGKIAAVNCGDANKTCTWTGSAYGCK